MLDLVSIKKNAKNIYIFGSGPSIDFFDISNINFDESIIITMNASIGLLDEESDIQIVMDAPAVVYYQRFGKEDTIWIGRKRNYQFLKQWKPNNHLLHENILNTESMGSGSTAIELALYFFNNRNIENVFITGIDFITINLKNLGIKFQYANRLKPYLIKNRQHEAISYNWKIGERYTILPENGIQHYCKQANRVAFVVKNNPNFRNIIQNHSFCLYEKIDTTRTDYGFPKYINPEICKLDSIHCSIITKRKIIESVIKNIKYERMVYGKRIIIVGPAQYLKDLKLSKWIDSHDIIIRLNYGVYAPPEYGSRTDIWMLDASICGGFMKIDDVIKIAKAKKVKLCCYKRESFFRRNGTKYNSISIQSEFKTLCNKTDILLNMAPFAILYSLLHEAKEIWITGMDFYSTPNHYFDGYLNTAPYYPSDKAEKSIQIHNQDKQKELVRELLIDNKNIYADDYIYNLLGVRK
jgi:hypothetical protein